MKAASVFGTSIASRCGWAAAFVALAIGWTLGSAVGIGALARAAGAERAAPDSEPTVVLKKIVVDRSELLTEEEIETLVGRYVGRELTPDELYDIVDDFNEVYAAKGFLAAALLPEQLIEDGVVEVRLVEGRIEDVVFSGSNHTKPDFVRERLGVAGGDFVALDVIEGALTAFNDTYDVQLHAELRAGEAFGTTDVVVHVLEPDNNEYSLWTDTGGRDEFGLGRYGFTWLNRSLFGRRDALTLSVTSGEASRSAALSYSVPVSRTGTRLSLVHSYNHIDVVAGEFHDVGIAGDSTLSGLTVDIPFRSKRGDRYGISAAHQRIESSTYFDGHKLTGYVMETWRLGTAGQFVRRAGSNHWGYTYNFVAGRDSVQPESFAKHTLAGSFQRVLRNGTVFAVTLSGQATDAELLPESEQFVLGGMSTVRGYVSGRLAGDEGYLLNVEWTGAWTPWLQWTLHLDHGGVFPYKGNLEPIGPDDYLTGAAIGFDVQMMKHLQGRFLWGAPLDKEGDGILYFRVQADF